MNYNKRLNSRVLQALCVILNHSCLGIPIEIDEKVNIIPSAICSSAQLNTDPTSASSGMEKNTTDEVSSKNTDESISGDNSQLKNSVLSSDSSVAFESLLLHQYEILVACETDDTIQFNQLIVNNPKFLDNINHPYLCSYYDDMQLTLLQLACACNSENVVKSILLIPQIDVNVMDPVTMSTALHIAVCMENISIVQILCEFNQCNINLRNLDGKTAVHIAVERNLIEITDLLLFQYSDVYNWKIVDINQNSIFHILGYHPNEVILKLLISHYCRNNDLTLIVDILEAS